MSYPFPSLCGGPEGGNGTDSICRIAYFQLSIGKKVLSSTTRTTTSTGSTPVGLTRVLVLTVLLAILMHVMASDSRRLDHESAKRTPEGPTYTVYIHDLTWCLEKFGSQACSGESTSCKYGPKKVPGCSWHFLVELQATVPISVPCRLAVPKVRNSWGEGWGDKGYFYMPYAYIKEEQLAHDFWAINWIEGFKDAAPKKKWDDLNDSMWVPRGVCMIAPQCINFPRASCGNTPRNATTPRHPGEHPAFRHSDLMAGRRVWSAGKWNVLDTVPVFFTCFWPSPKQKLLLCSWNIWKSHTHNKA